MLLLTASACWCGLRLPACLLPIIIIYCHIIVTACYLCLLVCTTAACCCSLPPLLATCYNCIGVNCCHHIFAIRCHFFLLLLSAACWSSLTTTVLLAIATCSFVLSPPCSCSLSPSVAACCPQLLLLDLNRLLLFLSLVRAHGCRL